MILGTGLPGGLWFVGCVLSLFEKSTFNFSKNVWLFHVVPYTLTSFYKKIPFEIPWMIISSKRLTSNHQW